MPTMTAPTPLLRTRGGATLPLHIDRWRGGPDSCERQLLGAIADPVLDVGCGPGRVAAALVADGRLALGIDPSPAAAAEATARGAVVLQRSVFGPLPGEGRWGSVVLLDGNVGIGGDPVGLLRRLGQLLRSGGHALVEVEPPGVPNETLTVRIERPDGASPWFPWARVGVDGFATTAAEAGLVTESIEPFGDRWFALAAKP